MLFQSYSSRETKQLARKIKFKLLPSGKRAVLVRLEGELGSGKTTFAQGLLASFGVKTKIISPTFALARRYSTKKGLFSKIFHMDFYRAHNPRELERLGFRDILKDPENLVIVEWPELAGDFFSNYNWRFVFRHGKKENERVVAYFKK